MILDFFRLPIVVAVVPAMLSAVMAADVEYIRVPESGLQPQVVVDRQGTAHLLYFVGKPAGGDVRYAQRSAGSSKFEKPRAVNAHPGSAIAVGSIRGAQLALGRNGRPHVVWMGSEKARPQGPKGQSAMLYTRLDDSGAAFEEERNVIAAQYGLDGGGSVAADPQGRVYVGWHGGQDRDEAGRRVWLAVSDDDGRSFAPEVAVDAEQHGACGCCGIRIFAGRDGAVQILYRSAEESVHRDMYLLFSNDPAKGFASQLLSRWQVTQCPMSSAFLAETKTGFVAAWETSGQVSLAAVDRETGKAAMPVQPRGGPGKDRKHPALAVNSKGEMLLVWTEGTGWNRGGSLAWQIFSAGGKPVTQGRRDGIPTWSFAAAWAKPDGTFAIVY